MDKLYTVRKNQEGASHNKNKPQHVAQIMSSLLQNSDLNWRNQGKPFKYDLNQIPYDYTVEVTNRFKGLDLVDRVLEKLQTKVRKIVQEAVTKTILKEKKCKQAKQLSDKALQTP